MSDPTDGEPPKPPDTTVVHSMDDSMPERIGPYHLLQRVGEGGMGEVYRAQDTRLGRNVAIKVLPEAVASDPERLARFEREAIGIARNFFE